LQGAAVAGQGAPSERHQAHPFGPSYPRGRAFNSLGPLQAIQVVSCEHEVPIERHPVSKEVGFDVEFYSVSILSNEVTGNRFVEISAYDFPQCRPVDCDSDKPAIDYGEKLNGPRGWYFSMNE